MIYLNEEGEEIQESEIDYALGHLVPDRRVKEHHEAVPEVPEEGHYWPQTFYFTDGSCYNVKTTEKTEDPHVGKGESEGEFVFVPQTDEEQGKEVKGTSLDWIVDKEGVPAKEAWDEYEDVQVYTLYTAEELEQKATEKTQSALKQAQETQREAAVMMLARAITPQLSDADVLTIDTLLEEWYVGGTYKIGDVRRYAGGIYRALADSTGAAEHTPDIYTAGWKRIDAPNEDGIYNWTQPLGATDAHNTGDKVVYNGEVYESLIDANVWSPDSYPTGWKKEETEAPTEPGGGEEEEKPDTSEFPEFVQPTGSHDAYSKGDKVTYNGKHYESTVDNNVWTPDAYPQGWKEV